MSGRTLSVALLLAAALSLAGCERSLSEQRGPAAGQIQIKKPSAIEALAGLNSIPPPEDPADLESPPASEVFVNVKVLSDLSATEFSRLMQAFSTWVAPVEGCEYCHNTENMESDEKYPKVVARRMIEMTRSINTEWKRHVGETGVTCWTCHRGQAVPSGDWFNAKGPMEGLPFIGHSVAGRNGPSTTVGGSSLPNDPLAKYLVDKGSDTLRVQATSALPMNAEPPSIQNAQWTYSLMMYMSSSLGVNCTYCHNTRALANWSESSPQRATAWHGIRLVRELNSDYLIPLTSTFPDYRLGPHGDAPKVGCATCHKGTFKPLNGVSPLPDYLALSGVGKVPAGTPSEPEPPPTAPKKR
ncbi:MAG: photosynthetic reaction center cytochrome PufC [Burkholderiales bacterium]